MDPFYAGIAILGAVLVAKSQYRVPIQGVRVRV